MWKKNKDKKYYGDQVRDNIVNVIDAFIDKNGYSPTYREIGDELGMEASNIHYHLNILKKEGRVSQKTNQRRTIRLNN